MGRSQPPREVHLVLTVGTWFTVEGWSEPEGVLLALLLGVGLGAPVLNLGIGSQAMRTATAAAGRLGELLNTAVLPATTNPGSSRGSTITFDRVGFSYDGTTEVLSDISLTLEPGTVTALVGPSGSGKSTLARLVPRFWDTTTGTVSIGGVDVRDLTPDDVFRSVGFVFQDPVLLRASVRDNLAIAVPGAMDAQIRDAARAAQIHDTILAMPDGYDTVIHEQVTPSGGEAQRLSIARALLADAPVIVLDEATAFADPESESQVQDALSHLTHGRTVLVIAHRLRTIADADRIIVLDRGRIVESGTHDELLEDTGDRDTSGLYATMWQTQQGANR